jgi:ribose 1,5-bisphosphokinase
MTWLGALLQRSPARIGPGRLVLVVGPSGAGKDTLIAGARAELGDDPRFVFPRRVVTRTVTQFEDHDSVDEAAFAAGVAAGAFAFFWDAHGLRYGVPASIDDDIRAGRTVVCNVSRGIVTSLHVRYENTVVVLVTAPAKVLAERLAARGRQSDGDFQSRLQRAPSHERLFHPDFTIENFDRVESGVEKLAKVISRQSPGANFPAEMLF